VLHVILVQRKSRRVDTMENAGPRVGSRWAQIHAATQQEIIADTERGCPQAVSPNIPRERANVKTPRRHEAAAGSLCHDDELVTAM